MNLTRKRILITRPRAQAEEFASALIAAGAQVDPGRSTGIERIDAALRRRG